MALLGATKLAEAMINLFNSGISQFMKFLLLNATQVFTQNVKFFAEKFNLCKFTTWCTDVLADKPHPRFDTKLLSKKMRLIRRCLRYL